MKVLVAWMAITLAVLAVAAGESFAATPNDPSFSLQWSASNIGQLIPTQGVMGKEPLEPAAKGTPGADDRALAAWNYSTGSRSIVVGVLDTGVDYSHPDLAANVWVNPGGKGGCSAGTHGYDVVAQTCDPGDKDTGYGGHGTHVAGIIGALGNNSAGVAGMNWKTTILPVRWLESAGVETSTTRLAEALEWIVKVKEQGVNVRVVNDSPTFPETLVSPAVKKAIEALGKNNILFVTAAGNTANNNDKESERRYPCGYGLANEICVTATDNKNALPSWAGYGPNTVDLAAPGVSIYSTLRGNAYGYLTGGSMASAQVAGAAALMLSAEPNLTATEAKARILEKVRAVPALAGKVRTAGVLDVCAVMPSCKEPTAPTVATSGGTSITRTSATLNGTVTPNGAEVTNCHFEYGITASYGSTAPCIPSPGSGISAVPVSAPIVGLSANTTYHFRLTATNFKETKMSADSTVTTNPPTVVTGSASSVTQTEAALGGTVNPNGATITDCHFNYGTAVSYGSTAPCTPPGPGSGTSPVAVSASIGGLSPNTTYHFQLEATNTTGRGPAAADATFTTLPNPPEVVTSGASAVTQTTGTLNGTVNPNGSAGNCQFDYGTSTSYGSSVPCGSSPGSGTGSVAVSASIIGLAPNTTYHFRALATNPGGTAMGLDQTLTSAPPDASISPPTQGTLPFVQQAPAPEMMRVRLTRTSLSVSRAGTVGVGLGCASPAPNCKGTLVLRAPPGVSSRTHAHIKSTTATVILGTGRFSVSPSVPRVVGLHLSATGRRLIARAHTMRAVLTLVLLRPDGTTGTSAVAVILRQARPPK